MSWLIWVIVAIVVIAVIAAVVAVSNKRKQEQKRTRAGELREQAAAQASGLQQREAHARETEARAAEARAEADRKRAEADRLEAEASDRHKTTDGYREQHVENLRRADELDPDVDTQHDGYEPPAAPATTGTATAGATDGDRVHDRLGGETTGTGPEEDTHEHGREATHVHTEDASTVTHPDGSTETVTPSSGSSASSTDAQAMGDPSDPRLEGGTHRA